MRAALLSRPAPIATAPLELVDVPRPEPGPGEMLLQVSACGVCRTDLQLAEGDLAARNLPVVPGHQAVGTVAALGANVEGWSPGDRAGVAWLASACATCRHCRAGRENLCEAARFTGWDQDGGFAEFLVARADFAFPLPSGFDDMSAAPLLCGGVIGYRALKISGIAPRGRLGLYGFGASALLALQVALHWNCEVFVATRSVREQGRARRWARFGLGVTMTTAGLARFSHHLAPAGDFVVRALEAVDRAAPSPSTPSTSTTCRVLVRPLWLERFHPGVSRLHACRRPGVPRTRRRDPHPDIDRAVSSG